MDREHWNSRYAGTELLWTAQANRFLTTEVAQLAPGRALDLGCGEGRNSVWLAERGWEVTGVDFAEVGLAKAAKLAEERAVRVEWIHADLLEFVPPRCSFDLVAMLYIHLIETERREILARSAAALTADGVLLVVGHDTSNLAEGHGGPKDPAVLFTPEEVARELPLRIERAEKVRRPIASSEGQVYAIDALVRASKDAKSIAGRRHAEADPRTPPLSVDAQSSECPSPRGSAGR